MVETHSIFIWLHKQSARILNSGCVLITKRPYVLVRIDRGARKSDENLCKEIMWDEMSLSQVAGGGAK